MKPIHAVAAAFFVPMLCSQSHASPFDPETAVDSAVLKNISGREGLTLANFALPNAAVIENSISGNFETGAVTLDGQAFQNMNGLAVINANSGNNVAVNSVLMVNISFARPTE